MNDPFIAGMMPHILKAMEPKDKKLRELFDRALDEIQRSVEDAENYAGSGMSRSRFAQALHEHQVGNACD